MFLLNFFLANFVFVVSHLKIYPVVYLNNLKALKSLYDKIKSIKRLLVLMIPSVLLDLKK